MPHPATHRQPDTTPLERECLRASRARRHQYDEARRHHSPAPSGYVLELTRLSQAITPAEGSTRRFRGHGYFDATVTASRFRPFARRRLRTARPALVFMRARKPWVRLRRIRLG